MQYLAFTLFMFCLIFTCSAQDKKAGNAMRLLPQAQDSLIDVPVLKPASTCDCAVNTMRLLPNAQDYLIDVPVLKYDRKMGKRCNAYVESLSGTSLFQHICEIANCENLTPYWRESIMHELLSPSHKK